jgi:hypothetical protein
MREEFEKWFLIKYFREPTPEIGYESGLSWDAWQAATALQAEMVREHDLADIRCECCGYMTYHREHMGCIRAAYDRKALSATARDCEHVMATNTIHWDDGTETGGPFCIKCGATAREVGDE